MADQDSVALPVRQKTPKAQLTQGMEHMRAYVTVESPKTESGEDAYGVPATFEPVRKPATASKEDNPQKRSDPFQFGTRYLEEGDDIFAHNAWDHVQVDPQYNEFIEQQTNFQRENQVSDFDKKRFNEKPEKWWDRFYGNNQANFFKDRKWLKQEFPILGEITRSDYGPVNVLEVGAGAGNTAFPILAMNENPHLKVHACDYSKKAIDIIRSQPAYADQTTLQADVWDVAGSELPPDIEPGTVDVVLMIFIFSALSPDQWTTAVSNLYRLLKPGGEILFRDYGRGDLAQVRFKKGRYLDENFYVRGDGTRVYFFDEDELREIWSGTAGANEEVPSNASSMTMTPSNERKTEVAETNGKGRDAAYCRFDIVNLAIDRRMLVNRQRKLKMYRCWMQGRFRKPQPETEDGVERGSIDQR